jgi:hypothetical protein
MAETKKFCPNCGKEVDGSAQFCPYCGYNLNDESNGYTPEYASRDSASDTASSSSGRTHDRGVAGMVFGILSLFVPYVNVIFAIIAIVLTHDIKDDNNQAKAGYVCAVIGLVLLGIEVLLGILFSVLYGTGALKNAGAPYGSSITATVGMLR